MYKQAVTCLEKIFNEEDKFVEKILWEICREHPDVLFEAYNKCILDINECILDINEFYKDIYQEYISKGFVPAIRKCRELTKCSLRDAKELVEQLCSHKK